MQTLPTEVLVIPDHHALTADGPERWDFTSVTNALSDLLAGDGPRKIELDLVFPDVALRGVDYPRLLIALSTFSVLNRISVEFVIHDRATVRSGLPAAGLLTFPMLINDGYSSKRRLTVQLMASEVFRCHQGWRRALLMLGIISKHPVHADDRYLSLETLLRSGYSRSALVSPAPVVGVMLRDWVRGPYIRRFPEEGDAIA